MRFFMTYAIYTAGCAEDRFFVKLLYLCLVDLAIVNIRGVFPG